MKDKTTHLYVDGHERTLILHSLVELKNALIRQGRYTDCVDELIFKVANAPVKRMKIKERIPAHYDLNNQVTRWGSKYETLIFPVITVLFGYFMLGMAKFSSRQEENGSNNENTCIAAGIVSLALFNAMTGYFLYTDINSIENLSSINLDINQLLFGLLGVAMIIFGNIMPKLRMNSVAGLRTVWSMKNETTWKKSQRFGGISFIIGGIIIIIVCFLTKGFSCFSWTMGIVAILLLVDIYYTYTLSKKI